MNQSRTQTFKKNIRWIIRDKYAGSRTSLAAHDYRRLQKKEPVDYIIGWTPFLDGHIDLSMHPLIPRPETEYWLNHAIDHIETARGTRSVMFNILDIFSGSGCIGIALAKHFPRADIDFADIDKNACAQIKINIKKNSIAGHTRVVCSDIFQNIKGRYDYIFANPPYVSQTEMKRLVVSVKKYEPRVALFGGRDGLSSIRRLLQKIPAHLKKTGECWMEFGPPQKKKIEKMIQDTGTLDYEFLKDQYGRWRVVRCTKK